VPRHRNVVLAHLWLAFAVFVAAAFLGVWQMWVRSPLHAPYENPQNYFLSVTAHGVSMAYVLTTVFVMGFGYFVAETALGRDIPAIRWAWAAFVAGAIGAVMAALTILAGRASVLYTFYPPLTGSPFFYIGLVLVVAGSWIWRGIMIAAMTQWTRANPGQAVRWRCSAPSRRRLAGAIPSMSECPARCFRGPCTPSSISGCSRPISPSTRCRPKQPAGGSTATTMGRLAFILFLLYSLPVGLHHLFMDPEHSNGFKFVQTTLTALVTVPTLLTVVTITASFEVAGRLNGGNGLFGWLRALPWHRPMVLATGLAFVMLWFGGGGLINMSYGMNAMIRNTSWVTAHFHLIFGGRVVIMYFAIAIRSGRS
jgi:cytochrome c oxidase subunit I